MNRRDALARLPALAALPWAIGRHRQTRPIRHRQVYPGFYHVVVVEPDGSVKVFGSGSAAEPNGGGEYGQGHTRPLERFRAYRVPGISSAVAGAARRGSSFAILADGRILAWGSNTSGILGITPLDYVEVRAEAQAGPATPTPIAAKFDAVALSVGDSHALALARDGSVWAWGEGGNGRLGIGPLPIIKFRTHRPAAMRYVPFPMKIPGLTDVIAVAAGFDHSLALKKDGTVWSWGANRRGQLGDGTTNERPTPALVPGVAGVVAIDAAVSYSIAVLSDGRAMAWGHNQHGLFGRPPFNGGSDSRSPTVVTGVLGARAVSAEATVLVVTTADTVISWGWNAYGDAGQGSSSGTTGVPPATIKGLRGVHSAVRAHGWCLAVLDDNRLVSWGPTRPWVNLAGNVSGTSASPILLNVEGLDGARP
jgi:alpha-tubulin suppressor-like RCC1 family protein